MNLGEMRQEVKSRLNGPGYRFLSDTRLNTFINQARSELDRMDLWNYREKSVTGTAPLVISDLGTIEAVTNTSQNDRPLTPLDYRHLVDAFQDLSTSGTPVYYYTATPSSPEIATYPVSSTDVIGVQYWKVCADLASDSDSPEAPSDFHHLIVDMATQIALRAGRVRVGRYLQYAEADSLQPAIDLGVSRMLQSYPPGIADASGSYVANHEQDF